MSSRPTRWERGRVPAVVVVLAAVAACVVTVALDLALTGELSLFFDLAFVVTVVGAAWAVRRRDFFVVAVLPPALMGTVVLLLAIAQPDAVAAAGDGAVQAVVSGLAHHAAALAAGDGLTLGILAVRTAAGRAADRSTVG